MAAPDRWEQRLDFTGAAGAMKKNEQGIAMISVLCLLLTAGMLVASAVALSRSNTYSIATHLEIQKSRYYAEGAAARVQYLLAADIFQNATRTLGETDYASEDYDRYLADNVEHEIDYYGIPVKFKISDTVSGFEFSQATMRTRLRDISDAAGEWATVVNEFFDKYDDYIDSDDSLTEAGMEVGEYEAEKLAPLPRNAAMQFREEFWFIPGVRRIFKPDGDGRLTALRLIMNGVDTSTVLPSVFTADVLMLRAMGQMEKESAIEAKEALTKWSKNRQLLSDTLDQTTYNLLKSSFNWEESGLYTIDILRAGYSGRPSAKLSVSILKPEVAPAAITNYMEFFFY